MALTVWTYDWVPEGPRGFVRDLRLRWALQEAGLSYSVRSTPFDDRGSEHLKRQPFGQVPFLTDGDISIFESGACLLHLAKKSDKRSEEHTSELQSLMRISYAVFCLKKKTQQKKKHIDKDITKTNNQITIKLK